MAKQRNLVKSKKTQLENEPQSTKFYLHVYFALSINTVFSYKKKKRAKYSVENRKHLKNTSYQFWIIKIIYRKFHTSNDIDKYRFKHCWIVFFMEVYNIYYFNIYLGFSRWDNVQQNNFIFFWELLYYT